MTAPARITADDFQRAAKAAAVAAKGCGSPARLIFRLEAREIEMIVGEMTANEPDLSEWTDDDV